MTHVIEVTCRQTGDGCLTLAMEVKLPGVALLRTLDSIVFGGTALTVRWSQLILDSEPYVRVATSPVSHADHGALKHAWESR